MCCFTATRQCILLDSKLLWVVEGVATQELSPQLVRNQELKALNVDAKAIYPQEH